MPHIEKQVLFDIEAKRNDMAYLSQFNKKSVILKSVQQHKNESATQHNAHHCPNNKIGVLKLPKSKERLKLERPIKKAMVNLLS
jgi:hypothetical protein